MLLDSKQLPEPPPRLRDFREVAHPIRVAGPPQTVAVVTMTLARSEPDARLLETALRALSRAGLPVWAGDGGSWPGFAERIGQLANVRVCPLGGCKPTLVNQLRTAFSKALESDCAWILYTEPDKRAFFSNGLGTLASAPQEFHGREPGLVVAARSRRGFATFPEGQRIAEELMNRICSEALRQPGDYTYGPMLISRRLAAYVQCIPENLGWGWRFFLMAVAHQLRMSVALRQVGRPCPRSQRDEDDPQSRDYRLRQLVENVTGLANGWTCLLDMPAVVEAL